MGEVPPSFPHMENVGVGWEVAGVQGGWRSRKKPHHTKFCEQCPGNLDLLPESVGSHPETLSRAVTTCIFILRGVFFLKAFSCASLHLWERRAGRTVPMLQMRILSPICKTGMTVPISYRRKENKRERRRRRRALSVQVGCVHRALKLKAWGLLQGKEKNSGG